MSCIYLVLDNIRSSHNVGAIFRTADGAGVSKIFLCGYTPAPTDRFGREVSEIKKTSLGATGSVSWEHMDSVEKCVKQLRSEGVQIVAVEQCERATAYADFVPTADTAFIMGNEIDGVSKVLCTEADSVIHIPMHGMKESLNVSVATGIILFHTRACLEHPARHK